MVLVDPPPLRVAFAFEGSWIKFHKFHSENMEMAKKNRDLKKKLKERDEMPNGWEVLFVGIVVCVLVIALYVFPHNASSK